MLTAKDGDLDEAEALDTGADDYLTKPFSFPVLVARLHAPAAARRRAVARRRSRSATSASTHARRRCSVAVTRSRSRPASSTCWSSSSAGPGRCSRSRTSSPGCGSSTFDGDPEHRRGVRRSPAAQGRRPVRRAAARDRAGRGLSDRRARMADGHEPRLSRGLLKSVRLRVTARGDARGRRGAGGRGIRAGRCAAAAAGRPDRRDRRAARR